MDRDYVIVRTGTGPVGMCLNALTSVLGGYSTVVTVHCGCPPRGIVPLHCRSDPSMPNSEARNYVRSAERSDGTRKAPIGCLGVMH